MSLYQKKLKFRPMFVDINRGRQFNTKFLALNPKGQVPVLVDDVRVIPDSEHIINYLEDNFANGTPRLRPMDHDHRLRVEQLTELIHELKVDVLTFGSVHHNDLDLSPKFPFDNPAHRAQMKAFGSNITKTLENEIIKHPTHADELRKQLNEAHEEEILWQDHTKFVDVLLGVEKVMDECEAELQSHEDNRWWLCSPDVSIADVSFSILLHRLWELGFDRRMWGNRPFIKRYYARVQQLDSFKEAISIKGGNGFIGDVITSPYFWGFLGVAAVAGGGFFLWNKHYGGNFGRMSELPPTVLTNEGISANYGGPADRLRFQQPGSADQFRFGPDSNFQPRGFK